MVRTRALFVALLALVGFLAAPFAASGSDGSYQDPDYVLHDLDNLGRTAGRQVELLTSPEELVPFLTGSADTWLANLGHQVTDLPQGRVYGGAGQLLPGGSLGIPSEHATSVGRDVGFVSRTGARLDGRIFWDGRPGPLPIVVVTSGSIQGPASGYWWAAERLARTGYLVLVWDAQGQGRSEVLGRTPDGSGLTLDGVPFQQEPNFVDGTVDALRFVLSTPAGPYVPGGWDDAEVAVARAFTAGERIDWHNPLWGVADRGRVGLAGHSLGARAVSVVQQCADRSDRWQEVPACLGRSYPIRAVVGWDRLQGGGDVVPVVPGMDQQADGYFLNPQPAPQAPPADANLGAYRAWTAAGVDTYSVTIRGGTHLEWSYIPLILPATDHGLPLADHYTRAWFDRYLHPSVARQRAGSDALLTGPFPDRADGGASEEPWTASFFSARHLSAFSFRPATGPRATAVDLRAHAGLSPVGDWAGANADRPVPRRTR